MDTPIFFKNGENSAEIQGRDEVVAGKAGSTE
jgi:hypothetical protein